MKGKLTNKLVFHGSIMAINIMFNFVKKHDLRFKRSVDSYNAIYQFRYRQSARQLIFNNGKIKTMSGLFHSPDFEIAFIDITKVIRKTKDDPGNMLVLLLENLICVNGNTFYLFKFGYLVGICDYYFRNIGKKVRKFSPFSLFPRKKYESKSTFY